MNWVEILTNIFNVLVFPVLLAVATYIITLVKAKTAELKSKTNNALADKYLSMLEHTVCTCVTATQQTYVKSLKEQGKFDAAAQKIAFQKTYNNVLNILNDDAKDYLNNTIGDVSMLITQTMEKEVLKLKADAVSAETITEE